MYKICKKDLKVEAAEDRCRVDLAFVLRLAPNGKLFTCDNQVFRRKKVIDDSMGSTKDWSLLVLC